MVLIALICVDKGPDGSLGSLTATFGTLSCSEVARIAKIGTDHTAAAVGFLAVGAAAVRGHPTGACDFV